MPSKKNMEEILLQNFSSSDSKKEQDPPPAKLTCYATWCVMFVAFVGLWQYGHAIGVVNAVYLPMKNATKEHYENRYNTTVSPIFEEAIWVVFSAAFPIGGLFGSLLVGPIVRRFGRVYGMLFGHGITILSSILLGCGDALGSPEVIILGRFGIGISSAAMGVGITCMYIIETSPRHLRGVFGAMISPGILFGQLMANIFGFPQLLGNDTFWPLLLALAGVPSLFFVLLFKTLPESPRKLFLEDDNEEKATEVLQRLAGTEDVSSTLNELKLEREQSSDHEQMTVVQLLRSSKLRLATLSAILIAGAQQATGVTGVGFNMNNIYLAAGFQYPAVYYISAGVVFGVFATNLCVTRLTDWFGRKPLLLAGYLIEGVSLVVLVIFMELQEISIAMAYVSVAASMGFWLGFSIGPAGVSILIITEFFDQSSRSAAVILASLSLWFFMAVNAIAMPYMLEAIQGLTFIPHAIIAFLTALYIRLYIPETKNRHFIEIQKAFRREVTDGGGEEEDVCVASCVM